MMPLWEVADALDYAQRKLRTMSVRPGHPLAEYRVAALRALSEAQHLVERDAPIETLAPAQRAVARWMNTLILVRDGAGPFDVIDDILQGFREAGVDLADWVR